MQKPHRLHRHWGQCSLERSSEQKPSQAAMALSEPLAGVHERSLPQKPQPLQLQRVQCELACFSRQKPAQPSTLASSLAIGSHALPPPEGPTAPPPLLERPSPSPGASLPPQKPHDLHAHETQWLPRCSALHQIEQLS